MTSKWFRMLFTPIKGDLQQLYQRRPVARMVSTRPSKGITLLTQQQQPQQKHQQPGQVSQKPISHVVRLRGLSRGASRSLAKRRSGKITLGPWMTRKQSEHLEASPSATTSRKPPSRCTTRPGSRHEERSRSELSETSARAKVSSKMRLVQDTIRMTSSAFGARVRQQPEDQDGVLKKHRRSLHGTCGTSRDLQHQEQDEVGDVRHTRSRLDFCRRRTWNRWLTAEAGKQRSFHLKRNDRSGRMEISQVNLNKIVLQKFGKRAIEQPTYCRYEFPERQPAAPQTMLERASSAHGRRPTWVSTKMTARVMDAVMHNQQERINSIRAQARVNRTTSMDGESVNSYLVKTRASLPPLTTFERKRHKQLRSVPASMNLTEDPPRKLPTTCSARLVNKYGYGRLPAPEYPSFSEAARQLNILRCKPDVKRSLDIRYPDCNLKQDANSLWTKLYRSHRQRREELQRLEEEQEQEEKWERLQEGSMEPFLPTRKSQYDSLSLCIEKCVGDGGRGGRGGGSTNDADLLLVPPPMMQGEHGVCLPRRMSTARFDGKKSSLASIVRRKSVATLNRDARRKFMAVQTLLQDNPPEGMSNSVSSSPSTPTEPPVGGPDPDLQELKIPCIKEEFLQVCRSPPPPRPPINDHLLLHPTSPLLNIKPLCPFRTTGDMNNLGMSTYTRKFTTTTGRAHAQRFGNLTEELLAVCRYCGVVHKSAREPCPLRSAVQLFDAGSKKQVPFKIVAGPRVQGDKAVLTLKLDTLENRLVNKPRIITEKPAQRNSKRQKMGIKITLLGERSSEADYPRHNMKHKQYCKQCLRAAIRKHTQMYSNEKFKNSLNELLKTYLRCKDPAENQGEVDVTKTLCDTVSASKNSSQMTVCTDSNKPRCGSGGTGRVPNTLLQKEDSTSRFEGANRAELKSGPSCTRRFITCSRELKSPASKNDSLANKVMAYNALVESHSSCSVNRVQLNCYSSNDQPDIRQKWEEYKKSKQEEREGTPQNQKKLRDVVGNIPSRKSKSLKSITTECRKSETAFTVNLKRNSTKSLIPVLSCKHCDKSSRIVVENKPDKLINSKAVGSTGLLPKRTASTTQEKRKCFVQERSASTSHAFQGKWQPRKSLEKIVETVLGKKKTDVCEDKECKEKEEAPCTCREEQCFPSRQICEEDTYQAITKMMNLEDSCEMKFIQERMRRDRERAEAKNLTTKFFSGYKCGEHKTDAPVACVPLSTPVCVEVDPCDPCASSMGSSKKTESVCSEPEPEMQSKRFCNAVQSEMKEVQCRPEPQSENEETTVTRCVYKAEDCKSEESEDYMNETAKCQPFQRYEEDPKPHKCNGPICEMVDTGEPCPNYEWNDKEDSKKCKKCKPCKGTKPLCQRENQFSEQHSSTTRCSGNIMRPSIKSIVLAAPIEMACSESKKPFVVRVDVRCGERERQPDQSANMAKVEQLESDFQEIMQKLNDSRKACEELRKMCCLKRSEIDVVQPIPERSPTQDSESQTVAKKSSVEKVEPSELSRDMKRKSRICATASCYAILENSKKQETVMEATEQPPYDIKRCREVMSIPEQCGVISKSSERITPLTRKRSVQQCLSSGQLRSVSQCSRVGQVSQEQLNEICEYVLKRIASQERRKYQEEREEREYSNRRRHLIESIRANGYDPAEEECHDEDPQVTDCFAKVRKCLDEYKQVLVDMNLLRSNSLASNVNEYHSSSKSNVSTCSETSTKMVFPNARDCTRETSEMFRLPQKSPGSREQKDIQLTHKCLVNQRRQFNVNYRGTKPSKSSEEVNRVEYVSSLKIIGQRPPEQSSEDPLVTLQGSPWEGLVDTISKQTAVYEETSIDSDLITLDDYKEKTAVFNPEPPPRSMYDYSLRSAEAMADVRLNPAVQPRPKKSPASQESRWSFGYESPCHQFDDRVKQLLAAEIQQDEDAGIDVSGREVLLQPTWGVMNSSRRSPADCLLRKSSEDTGRYNYCRSKRR